MFNNKYKVSGGNYAMLNWLIRKVGVQCNVGCLNSNIIFNEILNPEF